MSTELRRWLAAGIDRAGSRLDEIERRFDLPTGSRSRSSSPNSASPSSSSAPSHSPDRCSRN